MDADFRKNSVISNNFGDFLQRQASRVETKSGKKSINFSKNWSKYVYTLIILLFGFTYCLVYYLFGSTMVDLRYMLGTTTALISYTSTFMYVGYLFGSLIGFSYKYVNRQLVLILMSSLIVVFGIIQPMCTQLWQLYLCAMLVNAGTLSFDMGTTVWIIEMWQHNSAPVLQLAKAVGGAGMVVAPLLAGPFIKGKIVPDNHTLNMFLNQTHNNHTGDQAIDDYNFSIDRREQLNIPFMVGGCANIIIPVAMLVMFFAKRYYYEDNELNSQMGGKRMSSSAAVPNDRRATLYSIKEFVIKKPLVSHSPLIKWTFVGLIGTSLSTYGAMENMHLVYSSTYYQLGAINMSATRAAQVLSVMNASLTVGKLLSTFIALKVKAKFMLVYHMIILAIAQAVLYFGRSSEVMVWTGNVLIGLGYSAIWPSYFQFGEDFVGLTDNIVAIFAVLSSICPMIAPFMFGPLVEESPDIFIYIEFAFYCITVVLFSILLFISTKFNTSKKPYDLQ